MTRVYLIRHGEAEGNIFRRAQGHYNSQLTAKGVRQVAALAERFRDERVDALYSSDLRRTMLTAGAITKYHDLTLQTDPRLREIALGEWEDRPFGDLQHFEPEQMGYFNDDPARWCVAGGELFADVTKRMRACVLELAERHAGATVVCVSHGMAIRALLADTLGVPSAEINRVPHGDNTCVSLLEIENGEMRVVFLNDATHLEGELSTFARQTWWREKGGADRNNIWFDPLDPTKEPELYLDFYKKTWRAVHGNLDGFYGAPYLADAKAHAKAHPQAIVTIRLPDGSIAGITELDTRRGAEDGCGWICLCYVEQPLRRAQLGVQLIGHAVSVFRALGRRAVRLHVFSGNTGALRFYEEYGFRRIGEAKGVSGTLYLMEKEL